MIIFDFQQVAISNIFQQLNHLTETLDENMLRHMILNTIRTYVYKFRSDYGDEIVLAYDSKNSWRKKVFANYKSNRKKTRDESGLDWTEIFKSIDKIKQELKEHSHYKVMDIEGAEADDIIAVLSKQRGKILILSSGKDFVQLHNEHVKQYSPILKKFITSDNPSEQLYDLIIHGDRSDGIPNVLSDDDVIVNGVRQKPITASKLNEWRIHGIPKAIERNFNRNKMLIDLAEIPLEIQENILNTYNNTKANSKMNFMNYMTVHKLKNLITVIDQF